jgi:alpha-L-rhamnosidase
MPSPVVGLDNLVPHFAWTPPASTARLPPASVQSAARVVITAFPSGTAVWDSGPVNGSEPVLVPPAPLPLTSDARYEWTVSTADGAGVWTSPSAPARFNTALLAPSDWDGAGWIGGWRAGTLLRKDFTVSGSGAGEGGFVSIFVSACQYYLLYIDGVRVGSRELDVAWTRFQYFRSYASYELDAALVPPGPHTIGLALGQGFCGQSGGNAGNHTPQGLLRLALHASDGTVVQPPVVTDESWFSGSGPVLTDSTYYGEQYNASMEQPGWAAPGFVPPPSAPAWTPAVFTNDPPTPPLMTSQLMPPIERVVTLAPLSVTPVSAPGLQRWTFDFGQQVAGRTQLAVPQGVPAGTNFTMKHAEVLSHPPFATYDASAWLGNIFWAYPVDSYIASGVEAAGAAYEPAFTEHGFRYVELSVDPPLDAAPGLDALTAVVLRTAARHQATVVLGNPLLQSLSNASWWGEAAALMGIPAGTAARGERTGWTGDASFASESELFDFDTAAFFTQFLVQLQQLQCPDGTVESCIPNTDPLRDGQPKPLPCANAEGDPSWGTVYPTITYGLWKYYAAQGAAARQYPSLTLYMSMLEAAVNATGLGQIFCTWGDWNPVVKTDCHITAAASYLHDLEHMVELATALGKAEDAAAYASTLAMRRIQYHAAFWNASIGLYGAGTQTAQAVALWTGVAAGAGVAGNVSTWLGQSMATGGLTFGFIGVRYAFEALALNGQIEAALRCLLQTNYPSYGFEL